MSNKKEKWSYHECYDHYYMQKTFRIDGEREEMATVWTGGIFEKTCKGEETAKRIVECLNACEGQSIETVKFATAHKNDVLQWERLMFELLGVDTPDKVRKAIEYMKKKI